MFVILGTAAIRCIHIIGYKVADSFYSTLLHFSACRKELKIESEAALCF